MTYRLPQNSLLDQGNLPFHELAQIGNREGRRPRPVYGSHKWFARRLGTSIRALLAAISTPTSGDFWESYYKDGLLEGVTVLDPFVGGGSILMESSRLGADGFGCDIDPVAAAISDFQLTMLWDLPDLESAMQILRERVGRALRPYYTTIEPDGSQGILLHAFWVHTVPCAGCGRSFDAHPEFRLASNKEAGKQWVICRQCGKVEEHPLADMVNCFECGATTDATVGNMKNGNLSCPFCGTEETVSDAGRRTGGPPVFRICAVETLPVAEEKKLTNSQRVIRTASPDDIARYDAATKELQKRCVRKIPFLADAPIPVERADNRPLTYGYIHYGELFNDRQKLHLGLLAEAIQRLDEPVRKVLQIAFSNHLKTNCMLTNYAGGWRRLAPVFSVRAFRHVARPVELNPWLTQNGRGTFPNAVRSITRAAAWLKNQQEHALDGGFRAVSSPNPGRVSIRHGDAQNLDNIADRSIDLVVTDPPYVNYISYSELAHFFTPWLTKFGLAPRSAVNSFPENQLASKSRAKDSMELFERQMRQVFAEIRRVVKEEGRIVLSYQFSGEEGWLCLGNALACAGIIPYSVFPILGDSDAGLHKSPDTPRWDAILNCRPGRPLPRLSFSDDDKARATKELNTWIANNRKVALNEADRINLLYALTLKTACNREGARSGKVYQSQWHDACLGIKL